MRNRSDGSPETEAVGPEAEQTTAAPAGRGAAEAAPEGAQGAYASGGNAAVTAVLARPDEKPAAGAPLVGDMSMLAGNAATARLAADRSTADGGSATSGPGPLATAGPTSLAGPVSPAGPMSAPVAIPSLSAPAPPAAMSVAPVTAGPVAAPPTVEAVTATPAEVAGMVEPTVARLQTKIQQAAAAARTSVTDAYDLQIAGVRTTADGAALAITTAAGEEKAAFDAQVQADRQRLADAHRIAVEQAQTWIAGLKQELAAAAEAESARAAGESQQRAGAVQADAQNASTADDPDLAGAQRKVAGDIGADTAGAMRQDGAQLAGRVRTQAADHAAVNYDGPLAEHIAALDAAVAPAVQLIDELHPQVNALLDSQAADAVTAVQALGAQTIASLEQQRGTALAEVDAWESQATATAQEAGGQAGQALMSFDQEVREESPDAVEGALGPIGDELTARLDELVQAHRGIADTTGNQVRQGLVAGGDTAAQEIRDAAGRVRQQLGEGITEAEGRITDASRQFVTATGDAHGPAMRQLGATVDAGLTAQDDLAGQARAQTADASGKVADEHARLKEEERRKAEAEEEKSWWDRVTDWAAELYASVRKWFKETFGDFWGGLLFGILSGLAMVAVGLLLGGLVILIAKVSAIAALVTAVVLLLAGIGLGIHARFQQFYADNPGQSAGFWKGLGLVGLGIADLTGIPFIVEGVVGQRAFGKEMDAFESSERIGQGVVFLFTVLFTAKKLIKGKAAPEEVGPVAGAEEAALAAAKRGQAVEAAASRLGVEGAEQLDALGVAYDVAKEFSAPFIVDVANKMLPLIKADAAEGAVIVFVGRDGHSLAVATQALDPQFFASSCREVVLSRAVVESAVLDLEQNAGKAFPEIADFRQAAGKVDPADIPGARQTLANYLSENGLPIGEEGRPIVLVDTSFKGTVQELLAAVFPENRWKGYLAFFGESSTDPHPGSKQGMVLHLEAHESNGGRPVSEMPADPGRTFQNKDAVATIEETLHGTDSSPKGFKDGKPFQVPQSEEGGDPLKGFVPQRVAPEYADPKMREAVKDVNLQAVKDEAERIAALRDAGGDWEKELADGANRFTEQVRKWAGREEDVDPQFARVMDSFVRRGDKDAVGTLAKALGRSSLSEAEKSAIWYEYDALPTVKAREAFAAAKAEELR
ncbi:hypothetical protein Val02_85270 [Virgisporangium aliadipatigenens]|uniref:Uncharacterized protein n=1 Tax=Virgisporangium aliadipatigenens TaxID=741659 RepID=A0A8J4DVN9_9ACTN|nr:hypothetical protein [Virgisporangium aliadipatigenens]GIJ51641.1 hypothetical protein Val02_85270 [Virgisporangium aliadipatigenens]